MKCPYCNIPMEVVEYDIPGVEDPIYTCNNTNCKPVIFVPRGMVPISVGWMINEAMQIRSDLATMNSQIYTKRREGIKSALLAVLEHIAKALGAQGFAFIQGEFKMVEERKPEIILKV